MRESERRDARRIDAIGQRAGVRDSFLGGSDRANDQRRRPELSGDRRSLRTVLDGIGIARDVARAP